MARTIAADHDEKRAQILSTAAAVFAENGFHGASMTRLSQACGISKANIYHYYDGKDALLFDVLDTYLRKLKDRVTGVDGAGLRPEQHLHAVILEILLAYRGADNQHRTQVSDFSALPEDRQAILRGYQREIVDHVSAILKAAAPDAFGGDHKRLHATTMSLFGMLNWYYMWNRDGDEDARRAYARLVADLVLNGVKDPDRR